MRPYVTADNLSALSVILASMLVVIGIFMTAVSKLSRPIPFCIRQTYVRTTQEHDFPSRIDISCFVSLCMQINAVLLRSMRNEHDIAACRWIVPHISQYIDVLYANDALRLMEL